MPIFEDNSVDFVIADIPESLLSRRFSTFILVLWVEYADSRDSLKPNLSVVGTDS